MYQIGKVKFKVRELRKGAAEIKSQFRHLFFVMFEDNERTFNLNMHTCEVFAFNVTEALAKIYTLRPEFQGREIRSINITCL